MLKYFTHCWLILSLLVAPLQFAVADLVVLDHANAKCEMMDMGNEHSMHTGTMDHGNMAGDACECPDQCKASCASAHISLGMPAFFQLPSTISSVKVSAPERAIHDIHRLTELRPPIA